MEITIGAGAPQQKSSQYRQAKEIIVKSGFGYLDNIAVTPLFFRRRLEDSGALSAKTNKEKREKIDNADIPLKEILQVEESIRCFQDEGMNRYGYYFRTDDPWKCPSGFGESVIAFKKGNSRKFFRESIKRALKRVIGSQFDDLGNVEEFKRIKGVEGDFGAWIVPIHASFHPNQAPKGKAFAPSLSLNFLGYAGHFALMQFSRGFFTGPERTIFVRDCHAWDSPLRSFDWIYGVDAANSGNHVFPSPGVNHSRISFGPGEFERFSPTKGFNERARMLFELGGGCFFEAARRDHYPSDNPDWAALQYHKKDFPEIQRPDISKSEIIPGKFDTIGMKLAETVGVRVIDDSPKETDIDFNRDNSGYLLLAKVVRLKDFAAWPLSAYSRAGAAIVSYMHRDLPVFSHLSNYLRELGIPILLHFEQSIFDYEFINNLPKEGKYLVYAHEFWNDTFIAKI